MGNRTSITSSSCDGNGGKECDNASTVSGPAGSSSSSSFGGAFTKQLDERGYNNFAIVDHLSSIQPAVLSIQFVRDQYELVINGEPNQVYSIHYSDNLHDWNILTNVSMPANGNKIIQLGPFDGNRYFRAVHDE